MGSRSGRFIRLLPAALLIFGLTTAQPASGQDALPFGVRDRDALQVHEGDLRVRVDGTVVENLEIRGSLRIDANNVVVRNVWVYTEGPWTIRVERGSATFEHVEIGHPDFIGERGIGGGNVTARYLNIHHVEDGIKAGDNSVYERIWVHSLDSLSQDPHADGLQDDGDTTNFILRDSILDSTGPLGLGNAAVLIKSDLGPSDLFLLERNHFNGGAYVVFVRDGGHGDPTRISLFDNSFGDDFQFGLFDIPGEVEWRGNFLHSTGERISIDGTLSPGPADYEPEPILTPTIPATGTATTTTVVTTTTNPDSESPDGSAGTGSGILLALGVGVASFFAGWLVSRRRRQPSDE